MNGGLPLARIAGIRVRAHWSVLVVSALLTWGLAAGVVPIALPGTAVVLTWVASAAAALLLIVSLTAHELAHSIVARRRGVAVDDITLWVFGGVSHIRGDWGSAGTETLVAAAGPAATLAIAAMFFGLSVLLSAAAAPALLVLMVQWLAGVNVVLIAFNLVPAFPLDGGRLLRGFLWWRRGDRAAATATAARAGRAFALLLVALGFVDFFLTGDFGGLWLVFIGWFLDTAAKGEQRGETARHVLQGVHVRELMSPDPIVVPSWITVNLLIDQYAMRHPFATFPTHGIDGKIDRLVTLVAMKRVPPNQRSSRRAADVMVPIAQVPVASPDELVTDLLGRVGPGSEGHALVFDGPRLVGVVSPSDVGRRLQLGAPPPRSATAAPSLPPAA